MLTNNQSPESTNQQNELSSGESRTTPRDLHKYIWVLVGIFFLFIGTFPLACWRVAKSDKFQDKPLNSIAWGQKQKANLKYPNK